MKTLLKEFLKFRAAGFRSLEAFRSAKTCLTFRRLESAGLVRLRAEPERENYFSVYGEPEGYDGANGRRVSAEQEREEICRTLDRDGLWYCMAEWFDGEEWQHADSVGMCMGYRDPLSPLENCYVPDLMASAVDKAEAMLSEREELAQFSEEVAA
jgi:hypothetical protein